VIDGPFQLFPALDFATEAALRSSIEKFGVLVPVVRDQNGNTLDGHHRARIADEIGVKYRVDVVNVESDEQRREIARTLNADRRHLSVDQRREVVADLREKGHSLRAIAGAVGASKSQVERDLSTVPSGTVPETVVGLDGKTRPSRRPVVVATKDANEAERAQQAIATAGDLGAGRVIDTKRIERIAREREAERRRAAGGGADRLEAVHADEIGVHHSDFRVMFRDLDLTGSVVVTDPPYPREYLPEWRDFASAAWDAGCSQIVAMTGQAILRESIEALAQAGWSYRWTMAYIIQGPAARIWTASVGPRWKPVVVADRGGDRKFMLSDIVQASGGRDKKWHHWGQDVEGFASLIEQFTSPGDLVVDPFLGGGTTAIAARETGRRFVGCDVDADAVATSRERLAA
jgi:site-specific DNA-methyltransferase (adenine-specific)